MQSFSPYQRNVSFILFPYVFIHGAVSLASAVVLTFFVHSESVPCRRAINIVIANVVHAYGNTEHRTHCDNLRSAGEQLHKQHARCIERVVFSAENVRFSRSVPVERRVKNGFGEVAVGIEVRPLSLTLETADDRVMPDHLFFSALGKFLVAIEQILDYARHFCGKFPVFFLLSGSFLHFLGILVEVRATFFFYSCECFFVFGFVVNAFGHSADNFHFVDRFNFSNHSSLYGFSGLINIQYKKPSHRG